jgi:pyruvate-ferredoxin/flavodoxin oxidoreductase
MQLSQDDRAGKTPFIWALDAKKKLTRLSVSDEMVKLSADRLLYWSQLREIAGLKVSESTQAAITSELEARYEAQLASLQQEYEARMKQLRETYPAVVARKMAEGLIRATAGGRMTVAEILSKAEETPGLVPISADVLGIMSAPAAVATSPVAQVASPTEAAAASPAATVAAAPAAAPADDDDGLAMEAYIDTDRCTSCNECTNLNGKMFAYNDSKQAYIKDVRAGTFAQLVTAAERCPAGLIHPGTPVNPKEKDLAKWVKRAEKFN